MADSAGPAPGSPSIHASPSVAPLADAIGESRAYPAPICVIASATARALLPIAPGLRRARRSPHDFLEGEI